MLGSLLILLSLVSTPEVRRVSTVVPFPRGLALVDGELYVLARGRVRGQGGADPRLDDRAGTIFAVDPDVHEPADGPVGVAATNGRVFAEPGPPMRLLRRDAVPATLDRDTDRPYCVLRYDPATASFYVCAFSGIDKVAGVGGVGGDGYDFRKNASDAVLRYDTRTGSWSEVDRHEPAAGWAYPMAGGAGLVKGPDNLIVVGSDLLVAAKDNDVVARYDVAGLADDPEAGVPPGEVVLRADLPMTGGGTTPARGPSALASDGRHLYVGYRTSGEIVRLPLDDLPAPAEVVARFGHWDPAAGVTPDLTDLAVGPGGDLYAVTARPAQVHRFRPDPADPYDGATPWADLAAALGRPDLKAENLLVADDGRVFVTTGDAYGRSDALGGAVYLLRRPAP